MESKQANYFINFCQLVTILLMSKNIQISFECVEFQRKSVSIQLFTNQTIFLQKKLPFRLFLGKTYDFRKFIWINGTKHYLILYPTLETFATDTTMVKTVQCAILRQFMRRLMSYSCDLELAGKNHVVQISKQVPIIYGYFKEQISLKSTLEG